MSTNDSTQHFLPLKGPGAMDNPRVSFVVPVYGSEACLDELVGRITASPLCAGGSSEILLVNDSSPDKSWQKITALASRDPRVRGINLRRNFGQDCALMAGCRLSRGTVIVIMDDDLQHDPADAAALVAEVEKGHDVCYGRFSRKKQAWWKNAGSWLNDKLANIVIGKPREIYLSPYKAIAGDVVREIAVYDGPFPYIDGLLFRVTSSVTQIEIEHHQRFAGRGNFSLARSIMVWLRLATSFSLSPLRLAMYSGYALSGLGFILAAVFTVKKLITPGMPLGWASTFVAILVVGGVQLVCLGLIGEYVGRVFLHLNRQPQYVIRETTFSRETT